MKNCNLKLKIGFCFFAFVFIFSFFLFNLSRANAAEFSISPVVIDEKAKARDILKKTVTLTNTADHKLNIYPSVKNINSQSGEEAFKQAHNAEDREHSLANWIEISRGVIELEPGEEKIVPLVINVNFNALPGNYHAEISFGDGSTRSQAEESADKIALTINLEVLEDIKEEMQLAKFTTDRIFFSGDDVLFNYQLENIGNKEVVPKGEVRIYNRKGEEVATIDANKEKKSFAPDNISQLASVWNADGFGRYKAFLNLDYGETQKGSIQDTVFFWVIPWKMLSGVFAGSLIIVIMLASFFHRWLEKRQLKLVPALAGDALNEFEPPAESQIETPDDVIEEAPDEESKEIRINLAQTAQVSEADSPPIEWPKPRVPMHEHPFWEKLYGKKTGEDGQGTPKREGGVINLRDFKKNRPRSIVQDHTIDLRNQNKDEK